MKLTFLGTGGALSEGRLWSSLLLNDHILFDTAPTAPVFLKKLKKDITRISHIFITHFHGDHTMGLPFLLADYAFKYKRSDELLIIGPSGMKDYAGNITEIAFPGVAKDIMAKSMATFLEISDDNLERNVGGIGFTAIAMKHFDADAYGYRVKIEAKTLAISGDTGPCENLKRLVRDADIVVLEMNFVNRDFPYHLNMKNIQDIRNSLDDSQKIIITHMEENEIPPIKGVIVSEDLQEYEFTS